MSMKFSEGIIAAKDYWDSIGKNDSSRIAAVNGLQGYISDNNIPYSPDVADHWLDSNKERWHKSTYTHYRRALKELELIIVNEPIPKRIDYCKDPLDSLPEEWKAIIKSYRTFLGNNMTREPVKTRISNCIKFAESECSQGITNPRAITAESIADYCVQLSLKGSECIKNQTLQYFLEFMSDKGILPYHHSLIITSPLQGKAYLHAANAYSIRQPAVQAQGTKPIDFWNDAVALSKHLTSVHGYNDNGIKHNYMDYLQMYYIFCEENNLCISQESQELWLSLMDSFWDNYRRRPNAKRALKLCTKFVRERILTKEELCCQQCDDKSKAASLCTQLSNLLDDFLSHRRKDNLKETTIVTNRTAVISFLLYLQENKISDIGCLTAEDVKNYFRYLSGGIVGKGRDQVYVIKNLLNIWHEEGLTKNDLSLAVPTGVAPTRRIVEILSDEEIARIYEYRDNAETAIQYRNSAVLLLGLLMGLRKVDIVNLCFSDIDWVKYTISITQQKTYRPLILPMPIAVGNSIYTYLEKGRPDFKTDYIFLSAVAPYRKAGVAICDSAINLVLPERNVSFHILRRTFATMLLKSGSSIDMIKETLGHSSLESVNRYLSMDDQELKSCCIPLERAVV